jgi:hypothetical protein
MTTLESPLEAIDIYDRAGYVGSAQHETFARLRRAAPVFHQEVAA